jgi:hypothetical protein
MLTLTRLHAPEDTTTCRPWVILTELHSSAALLSLPLALLLLLARQALAKPLLLQTSLHARRALASQLQLRVIERLQRKNLLLCSWPKL